MQNSKLNKRQNGIIIIDTLYKNQEFSVNDGEQKTFIIFLTKGKNEIGEIKVNIKGRSVNIQILGIILGYNQQTIRLYSLQNHAKPESISNLLIKSVLFDKAKFYYQGLIKIGKGAQKSNAYQKNQNLMMSKSAWAKSQPYLEILANNVRCTHGATIGKIDQEQLYYLTTRGLNLPTATKLLINGFFSEVLQRIPSLIVRSNLERKIADKINKLLPDRNE